MWGLNILYIDLVLFELSLKKWSSLPKGVLEGKRQEADGVATDQSGREVLQKSLDQ